MEPRRSNLLSAPYLSLYLAAVGALLLNFNRARYGSEPWFVMAASAVFVLGIVPLRSLFKRRRPETPPRPPHRFRLWGRMIFCVCCAVLLPAIALPSLGRDNATLIAAVIVISAAFAAIALVTFVKLRRPPPG